MVEKQHANRNIDELILFTRNKINQNYYKIQTNNNIFQVLETHDFVKKSYIMLNAEGHECVLV